MTLLKLSIELVPRTCFYKNLRAILSRTDWEKIRKQILLRTNNICEICSGKSINRTLDCHETWEFDELTKTQKLKEIRGLCEKCHEVKHIGLAQLKGNFNRARKHFININNISEQEADELIRNAFLKWELLSKYNWNLDTTNVATFLK